jgi:hypothetical protein
MALEAGGFRASGFEFRVSGFSFRDTASEIAFCTSEGFMMLWIDLVQG